MTCVRCLGHKHVKVNGAWIKCDCFKKASFFDKAREYNIPEAEAKIIFDKGAECFGNLALSFAKCEERLVVGDVPKKHIIIFGQFDFLKKVELFFFRKLSDGLYSYSMFDIVDAFFNDTDRFRDLFKAKVIFIYLGSEVQNEAAAKVLAAIFVAANMSRTFVVLLGCFSSYKAFVSVYPPSMDSTLINFKVKVL